MTAWRLPIHSAEILPNLSVFTRLYLPVPAMEVDSTKTPIKRPSLTTVLPAESMTDLDAFCGFNRVV
jgi:hypothetical protein